MNDFEKRFDLYLCSMIFQKMKIMVNDMNPIIESLKIFINDIILSPKNDVRLVYRLSPFEIYIDMDENIKEYRIDNDQKYDCTIINLDLNNVASYFKEEKESYFDKLKELNINIPNELYGTSFICFIAAINYFIENVKFTEEVNIHDIFIFSSFNEQNVIRRVD